MPRRKAPPRRNEGVGVEAASTPPARKKPFGDSAPPLAEPVEVAIRERQPEDVAWPRSRVWPSVPQKRTTFRSGRRARVRSCGPPRGTTRVVRVGADVSTRDRLHRDASRDERRRRRRASRRSAAASGLATLRVSGGDARAQPRRHHRRDAPGVFPGVAARRRVGPLRAASGLGDEHPEDEQKKTTTDAEKNRLRVTLGPPTRAGRAGVRRTREPQEEARATATRPGTLAVSSDGRGRTLRARASRRAPARRAARPRDPARRENARSANRNRKPKPRATRRRRWRPRRRSRRGGAGVCRRVPRAFAGSAAVPAEGGALDGTPGEGGADAASKACPERSRLS